MSKMIGITFTCSKTELKEVIRCLDPARIDWVQSDYVEQLSAFLEETLDNYKDEGEEND